MSARSGRNVLMGGAIEFDVNTRLRPTGGEGGRVRLPRGPRRGLVAWAFLVAAPFSGACSGGSPTPGAFHPLGAGCRIPAAEPATSPAPPGFPSTVKDRGRTVVLDFDDRGATLLPWLREGAGRGETLVRMDCEGRTLPGLAASWRAGGDGRVLRFSLLPTEGGRPAAPAPQAILRRWPAPGSRTPDPWAGLGAVTFGVDEGGVLRVEADRPLDPARFAHPLLAIGSRWETTGVSSRPPAGIDPLEAVDEEIPVLRGRDPRVIAYARSSGRYREAPGSWDRVYVLVVRPSQPGWPGAGTPEVGPIPVRSLAPEAGRQVAEALRQIVREPPPTPWWTAFCPDRPMGAGGRRAGGVRGRVGPAVRREPVVTYPGGDPLARDLAERIVALARGARGGPERVQWAEALGLEAGELSRLRSRAATDVGEDEEIGAGRGVVRVGWLPGRSPAPCVDVQALRTSMGEGEGWLVPLVSSRSTVLLTRDAPSVIIEWDGDPVPVRGRP